MDLSKLNNSQLKACLSDLKDKTSGNKQELILRLQAHDDDIVKELVEKYAGARGGGAATNLLDISLENRTGEESIANLTGEVAMLKSTMEQLMQRMQTLFTGQQLNTASSAVQHEQEQHEVTVPDISSGQTSTNVTSPLMVPVLAVNNSQVNTVDPMVQSTVNAPLYNNEPNQIATSCLTADVVENTYAVQGGEGMEHNQLSLSRASHVDVRDVVRIMPEFYPGSGLSSTMFINRINQLSRAYGWTDQMILYAIYDKLKGPARQWVNAMPIFQCWNDFVQAFLSDFPSEINSADLNMRMMRSRMNRNETYIDYFYRMLALGRSGGMQDPAINTYIINGLYDDTMKKILLAMHFPRCADLLRTLNNFHGDRKSVMSNNQLGNMSTQSQQLNNRPHNMPMQIQPTNNWRAPRPTQSTNAGIVCFRCRDRGHFAKNCPKFRRPNGTERINNINMSEDELKADQNATVNSIVPTTKRTELMKQIIILCNPNVVCNSLIDSGSGRSLIRRSVANMCAARRISCNELLLGFAGGEVRCNEKLEVEIKIDEIVYPVELLVVEDEAMRYDLLVGIDILTKGTVVIENGVCRVMSVRDAKIIVDEGLPKESVQRLENILDEFAHCFGEELYELGKSKHFKMDIQLTSNKPVVRQAYDIPIPKQIKVEQIINELLELNIIRPSKSAYASPILLVAKPNGESRLCVDYRELNSITEKQPWHMPTVDGVLATLSNKSYFTTLDLMSGYYQLEVEEASRPFTAFITHLGQFEFCRMPFGLRNAPSAFQRMMNELIAPLGKTVISYVDEVIIATDTAENNLEVLIKFLKVVEEEGLTLRLSKCTFLKRAVTFLGHEVDGNGIHPGAKKINAIKNYPTPQNRQEVRRFLGLAGFFRKFIPMFSIIAKPINNLLKNHIDFEWCDDCENAFCKIIQLLTEEPVLAVYDVNKNHQLHTDASSVGIAAILLQQEDNGLRPVSFFSRTCTATESSYHAYELEVLAVVDACQRFRKYLLGKHFSIITDCHSIASMKLHKPMIPRVARWFLKLSEYDYDISHRSGERMRHVDAMSRAPTCVKANAIVNTVRQSVTNITVDNWVTTLQREDPKLLSIMNILNDITPSAQKKQLETEYCLKHQRLYRKINTKLLLVVPRGVRWRVLKSGHDDMGHPGVEGTLKHISEHFWFPRMRNFSKAYLKSCVDCSYFRQPPIKQCELHGMEVPSVPFQVLHMDHLGPFVKSKRGNEYILVIVDALSRYSIIVPVKSTKTKPVVDTLNHLTGYFGLPKMVVTDRGTAFTSEAFAEFCRQNNIYHNKVAVRTPRANGLAERVNQAVLRYLKPSTKDPRDWDAEIRMLQWTLNTTVNGTTKIAPVDLIFDFPLRDLSGNKLLHAMHDDVQVVMNERRTNAVININNARKKWKQRFDAKHQKPIKYEVGELVLIESPPTHTGESRKLQPVYRGPYEITRALRFDRYVVADCNVLKGSGRKFTTVVASDKMKKWCSLLPDIDDDYDPDEDD